MRGRSTSCWTVTMALLVAAIYLGGPLPPSPVAGADAGGPAPPAPLGPLPALARQPDPKQVALGRSLFFDGRLSGDGSISCASCHDPAKGFADGLPLAKGYPGALYFRNTPTVLNAVHGRLLYWDGRLPASDLPTLVRDHLSEAHFMQADGRLLIERLRQIPVYEAGFKDACGGEPSYGRILNALTAYVQAQRSREVPFDRYLGGESGAISEAARRGIELFKGKAACIRCHDGPMLSDGRFHDLGLAPNRDIFRSPERHIAFRRFCRTLGVPDYSILRADPGLYAVTKSPSDRGRFRTPTLREVARTPPYMHDGSLATIQDVLDFYDRGGGPAPGKDPLLKPLGLSSQERGDLVEFLQSLSGASPDVEPVEPPPYELRPLGAN